MTIDKTNIPASQDSKEEGDRKRKKTWNQIDWWVGVGLGMAPQHPAARREEKENPF